MPARVKAQSTRSKSAPVDPIATSRQKLVQLYQEGAPDEQLVAQLFSVIYAPVNRVKAADCLASVRASGAKGLPSVGQALRVYVDNLMEKGVLIQLEGQAPQCHPLVAEILTRDAVRLGRFETLAQAVEKILPIHRSWKNGPRAFGSEFQFIREFRLALYRNNLKEIRKTIDEYNQFSYTRTQVSLSHLFQITCNNPFDANWFCMLSEDLYEFAIANILYSSMASLVPANEAFMLLEEVCAEVEGVSETEQLLLVEQLIFRGRLPEAQAAFDRLPTALRARSGEIQGWLDFLRGDTEMAIAHYSKALQVLKKETGKRKIYFQTFAGLFFVLALLATESADHLADAKNYANLAQQLNPWFRGAYSALENLASILQGDLSARARLLEDRFAIEEFHILETLTCCLCVYWADAEDAAAVLPKALAALCQRTEVAGYRWLSLEIADLLSKLKPTSPYAKQVKNWRQEVGSCSLVNLLQAKQPWELCLNALTHLRQEPQAIAKTNESQRLVWFVTYYTTSCVLQPREQSLNAKGEWGKGRPIALKRLKSNLDEFNYITAQDREVCSHLKVNHHAWGKEEYVFGEKAIASLIGHPLVFWDDAPTTRIEIVRGEPELIVKKNKDSQFTLQLSEKIPEKKDILVLKETPTRLKVIEVTEQHRHIASILGPQNRLAVPAAAKERVLAAISAVSGVVTVHSDIGGGVESAETVPADPKPHVHLLPASTGLKVAVLTRPFTQGGSYYRPGAGGETVIAEVDGKRLQTTRNLREEKKLANAAIAACPTLVQQEKRDNEWLIEDPEDCLELLLELQALGDSVILEWPEGEKMRVRQQAGLKDFKMTIKRQNDWFDTNGELKLDDNLVLDMQQLMQLLAQTPSRFIPLGNGEFLALTQEFRKRLDELRAFAEKSGKGLRLHPLSAIAVEDWMEEVGDLKTDKHWKAHIQRLKEIQNFEPELPSTLQADLRDYQIDGFRWMARLAHWGVGACLADDMGLGKTLQALALILTRAPAGATLVIAPTSVCMNWTSEAQRFAPTLNVIQFGGGDRQKVLNSLQPFDLVVCSYGLLQQEEVADMLAKVEWQTIVLDEAQSIKNFATKRSQAAMNLKGGFKLITTGTPIENHLGELWNLFRFINPGLLGSMENFNQRFATPIERYGDKQARNRLKKLIQPFLLRRTKSQVLEELPSRTEIVLNVELSREEMAFYEALRREAIAKLSESDAAPGAKHLQVLAEIMRLRRACCNPRLVTPGLSLPSSKLQLFTEVLEELLENRHKALVFSQFVDHLKILREHLDAQKIPYQYLDGSTPAAERKKRVDAFQAGTGDVFLISLKAGGTGLNLTAADYVIHMDPWWNPAVEDQASDRAHRIGQQRPVTIYRLVASDTIEEKIVELHHHKRDLADSLLEGADMSGKISTEDLLRLLQEG